ncbi:MAG TPA: hypothetical protein VMW87_07590 [Spirochaetia bacterium]|nr:hypothetical protein [Spirochaetia bacterium]
MTLHAALVATRKRRLRPERYVGVAGALIAFLVMVLLIRFGSNLYLSLVLKSHFFRTVNVGWCALFLCTVAPVIAFRGIARTARSPRLGFFPMSRGKLLSSVASASLRGVPVFMPLVLLLTAWLCMLPATRWQDAVEPVIFVLIGGTGFLLVFTVVWLRQAREDRLELIEMGLLAVMILANPDFQLAFGRPRLTLFMHWKLGTDQVGFLYLLPLIGAGAVIAAVFVSAAVTTRKARSQRASRRAGLVLYGNSLSVGLLLATYAVEIPVILTNPAVATTVRSFVLVMLAVRLLWFFSFLFRTEQAVGRIVRAPQTVRDRLSVYRPAAVVHLLLCGLPVLLYAARIMFG